MAYVAPTVRSVGDAVTAADYNIMANNALQFAPFVQGVFTNEAARDAAITSPTEGMHVYLTAPTVPAATGAITAVPTGIQTIYNGSVWVCVTEIGARSETNASTQSTSFVSTLTGDATAISVTLVTGTTALVSFSFSAFTSGTTLFAAVAVSGASTIAASNGKSALKQDLSNAVANISTHGNSFVFTGLTAGTNTFTLQYKTGSAVNAYFDTGGRNLVVKGIA